MLRKLKYLPKFQGRSIWRLIYGSKWVAAGALIFDEAGRLLLIRHRWRGGWEYPVGMSDGNESPLEAAKREVYEEVGLKPGNFTLIGVDFFQRRTPNGNLVFTFATTVDAAEAARLKLDKFEATDHRWVTRAEADQLAAPWLRQRLRALFEAYDNHRPVYLETGAAVAD
jgi:8-oxo-dGTP diphosphatase